MNSQLLDARSRPLRPAGLRWRGEWRRTMVGIAVGDALCVAGGFVLAYALRFFTDWEIFRQGDLRASFYATLILLLVPSWLALFALYGLYNPRFLFGGTTEYARIFNACTAGLLLVIVLTFLQPNFVIARGWLLLAWASVATLAIGWRFTARRVVYGMRKHGLLTQRIVILGANVEGRAVAEQLASSTRSGVHVVGFIDDGLPPGSEVLPGAPVLGPVAAFEAIVAQSGVDGAIIADTELVRERLSAVYGAMDALRRLDVSLAPGLFELLTIGVQVREQGSVPLLQLNKTRITGLHAVGKALIDRGGALAGLILLAPLLLLVALLVRLDSPGPVIYRRRVVGAGNRQFDAYKFRTMRVDGGALLTPELRAELQEAGKLVDDPRITPLGRLLRRTSIDELPQLVNVLLGQMSLVGPRMITADELRHFGRWRHNLVTVRPGMTGLWQVSGRSTLGYDERVRLDMHYIRNYSIWLDLYIIYRTVAVVLSGRGAF
jgi:exopolysaccharide biosynthesis polyprenyl glycosylphosphotransferase